MNGIVGLAVEVLTGYDFLVAAGICLFVEYIIKGLIFRGKECPQPVMKLSPVILGAVIYVALAFIQKADWVTGLTHGLCVGLASMGFYSVILQSIKQAGRKSLDDMNEAVKEAMKRDPNTK